MSLSERDELLIQRCADDELSAEQTRVLLERLDGMSGGWKSLACRLMEDRYLRKAVAAGRSAGAVAAASSAPVGSNSDAESWKSGKGRGAGSAGRVWRHPLTSLALCAAIAFVGGLLIPDGLFSATGETLSKASPALRVAGGGDSGRMELQMPGRPTVRVPIYSDPAEWAQNSSREFLAPDAATQYVIIPTADGRAAVVPVSTVSRGGLQ
jgi:hypothetical protein